MKKQTIIISIISLLILGMIVAYWPNSEENTVAGRIGSANNQEFQKYKSPELSGLTNWMNSEAIESIESLKGKVVLVDFWTYSCVNCIRTFPHIQSLQEKYADKGLVILGIHAPEFGFEKVPKNVARALKKYGLTYPVALDNNFSTWRNFKNRFWPAKYLIDTEGNVVYTHFGEGAYEETENKIVELLKTAKVSDSPKSPREANSLSKKLIQQGKQPAQPRAQKFQKTPETYLGTSRRKNYLGFNSDKKLSTGQWTVSGNWTEDSEKIFSKKIDKKLELKMSVHASEANLVLGGNATVKVFIDGKLHKEFKVDSNDLYNIFDFEKIKENYIDREIRLEFSGPEIEAFAWTFG